MFFRKSYDLKKQDVTPEEVDNIVGSSIVRQLNRIITNNLCGSYNHLKNMQVLQPVNSFNIYISLYSKLLLDGF